MKENNILRNILLLMISLILMQCTQNPFFDDEISENSNRIINGKVILSDETTPANVYVWLEGFNLSTYTDVNGDFEIELPPKESQPGGGLNGIFNLYYYISNYKYATSSILVINGSIEYGKGDVNVNGYLTETIILHKMLEIELTVEPSQIRDTFKDPIFFTVRLNNLIDTVVVQTHHNQWGSPSSLIFLKDGAPIEQALFLQGQPAELREVVITEEIYWYTSFVFSSNFFSQGRYEVRPYLEILQEGLPDELLKSIDEDFRITNYKYLLIPIRLQEGILLVTEL